MNNPHEYPDPTAMGGEGNGPFYNTSTPQQHHQRIASHDEMEMAATLARNMQPMMANASSNGLDVPDASQHGVHHYDQQQHNMMTQSDLRESGHDSAEPSFAAESDNANSENRRKRSKTSQACDECRRKKIKCDGVSTSGALCANCQRTNSACTFTRVQQRRGPNKGYIQNLADRLSEVEERLPGRHNGSPNMSYNEHDAKQDSPFASIDRKRTRDSISSDFGPYQGNGRQLNYSASYDNSQTLYTPNGVEFRQVERRGIDTMDQTDSLNDPFGVNLPSDFGFVRSSTIPKMELRAELIDAYYKHIHPSFPILSNSQEDLQRRILSCPISLNQAFIEVLRIACRQFIPTDSSTTVSTARELLEKVEQDLGVSQTKSTKIIHLQIKLLLAIEAMTFPTSSARGRAYKAHLSRAFGEAMELKLDVQLGAEAADHDDDSDSRLGRRVWWSLVMLDRFAACSRGSRAMVPETRVTLGTGEVKLLGTKLFELIRLSAMLVPLADAFSQGDAIIGPNSPLSTFAFSTSHGRLQGAREVLPDEITIQSCPEWYLLYWFLRLLVVRIDHAATPAEVFEPAAELTTIIVNNPETASPILSYYSTLAALTFLELLDSVDTLPNERPLSLTAVDTRSTASRAADMVKLLADHTSRTKLDELIRVAVKNKFDPPIDAAEQPLNSATNRQGLEQLASLAASKSEESRGQTGEATSQSNPTSSNFTTALCNGFLGTLEEYAH